MENDKAEYKNSLERLGQLAKRRHYYCDDNWYSCPKAEDGCSNSAEGPDCNCGAIKHNAEVDVVMARLERLTGVALITKNEAGEVNL